MASTFDSPDVVDVAGAVVVAVVDAFDVQDVRKDFVAAKIVDPTSACQSTVASTRSLAFPIQVKVEIIKIKSNFCSCCYKGSLTLEGH